MIGLGPSFGKTTRVVPGFRSGAPEPPPLRRSASAQQVTRKSLVKRRLLVIGYM